MLLNTDSRIQADYSADQRVVRLLPGEVAHNPGRPFLKYAGANVVRAAGTASGAERRQANETSSESGSASVPTIHSVLSAQSSALSRPPEVWPIPLLERHTPKYLKIITEILREPLHILASRAY